MGFRFRKSIKLLPGVRLNIGSKSMGISIGGKFGGISFNTKRGASVRASVPGTGISCSSRISDNLQKPKCENRKSKNVDLQIAQNYARIIMESAEICKETVNPEVFFSRCDLLAQTVRKLYDMRETVSIGGNFFDAVKLLDDGDNTHIREFISRYFKDQFKSAENLKTANGKIKRMQKALEKLMEYSERMDSECLQLASGLCNDYIKKMNAVE